MRQLLALAQGRHRARCPGGQRLGGSVSASIGVPVSPCPVPPPARWPRCGLRWPPPCSRSRAQDARAVACARRKREPRPRAPREARAASLASGFSGVEGLAAGRDTTSGPITVFRPFGSSSRVTQQHQQGWGDPGSARWPRPAWEGGADAGNGAQRSGESVRAHGPCLVPQGPPHLVRHHLWSSICGSPDVHVCSGLPRAPA